LQLAFFDLGNIHNPHILLLPVEFITKYFKEVFDPTIEITGFRTITGLFPVISIGDYLYFRGQSNKVFTCNLTIDGL
jgi:hypothetical protein